MAAFDEGDICRDILLLANEGLDKGALAQRLGVTEADIEKARKRIKYRFHEQGAS